MNYHSGYRYQQGRGIGSMFSWLFRALKPLASASFNIGKKIVTSDAAKSLGSTLIDVSKDAAKNVLVDVLEGKKFKDSTSEQLEEAKSKIAKTLKGEGGECVRKRKRRQKSVKNKQAKYDLLDD